MKNGLAMRLFSRRSLTESVAHEQINALSSFGAGLMRPDKCSAFEPIRAPFDPTDIAKPVQWLAKPHGAFLYRKGLPVHASGVIWNLTHSPNARFPSPLFANYWTGEFDGKWVNRIGIEKVDDFFSEMFRVTDSDFGLLTSEVDLQSKNRTPALPGQVQSLSYKGLDPERGVPGLYWTNLFSEEYAAWLGLSTLSKKIGTVEILAGRGVLLKFGESPAQCRSPEVLQRQQVATEWLGPEKFFDIRSPDRKLDTPNWNGMALPTEVSRRVAHP